MTQLPASTEPDNSAHARHVVARRGAVRTAWTMGGIAFAVYVLFILTGVLAQ
ncbi:MAG: hypothetical protein M3Q13_07430 [Pseudomonadota bacterium]|nr:hypothetical protein [Pseudomonadota bacterium]